MTSFFTDFFRSQLSADPTLMNAAQVRMVLFREAPVFSPGDARYVGIQDTADLLELPGWLEASATDYPLTNNLPVGVRHDMVPNHYVMFTQYPFTGMGQAEVNAVGVEYVGTLGGVVNPLIFVTDTPFSEMRVVKDGDGVTANDDQNVSGASKKWLFSWADAPSGSTQIASLVEGPLVLYVGPPDFEPSHTQHVWLFPQRANMMANPGFEKPGVDFWSTNGSAERVAVAAPIEGQGTWAGHFFGASGYVDFPPTESGGAYLSVEDFPELAITEKITFVMRMRLSDWDTTHAQSFFKKGDQFDAFAIEDSEFRLSLQAADDSYYGPSISIPNLPDDGEWLTLAVSVEILDASNERFTVSTYDEGTDTWTAVSDDYSYGIGALATNSDPFLLGRMYYNANAVDLQVSFFHIYDGIPEFLDFGAPGSTLVFQFNDEDLPTDPSATTFTATSGQEVTVVNDYSDSEVGVVSNTVKVESNVFPTSGEEFWTIQLLAKGTGKVKVGFVWWRDLFDSTGVDWGTETWELQPDSFIHIAACRNPTQTYQGMVRIECDGGDLTIDNVLCERGFLKEWPYFDGDSTYGARDDYSWYGGMNRRGASYSFWYNNKRAIYGRLFSRDISDDTLITDEVMAAQGFVYRWVPAGTFVVAHIDVLHPNDIQAEVPPKKPGVIAYKVDEDDTDGVVNPWL